MQKYNFALVAGAVAILALGFGLGIIVTNSRGDFTMTQGQAKRLAEPVKVYMTGSVQEDDLYINDEDIGRVDFVADRNYTH